MDAGEVTGMDVPPIVALVSCVAIITLIILLLRWLARPHNRMYTEIRSRCADIQARAALRAAAYDQTPVLRPSVDGLTTGAGTPDPAPVVTPRRVHIDLGGIGRHREVA
jgi:hypothetical protein